ncbi:MAG: deoxyribose-phosphate aldolase [Rhodothermales bacterium]
MDQREKEEIIRRLTQRFGGAEKSNEHRPSTVEDSLHRLVHAGASRFGVRADTPAGFSACDLAPPLARMIDHTALKPETSVSDIRVLCDEARQYCFASVCINPSYVRLCAELLSGTPVAVCTVIGFPLGANRSETKARETELSIRDGATEVDMVLNVGMLKSADYAYVEADIKAVVDAARKRPRIVTKVILETALLTDEEKVIACVLAQNAGADFVKTSTGFSKGGATAADIALMRRAVGKDMGVKASGGIRSTEDAETMIAHGATRIGASASVAILKGLKTEGGY